MNESLPKPTERLKLGYENTPKPERSESKEAPVVKFSGELLKIFSGIPSSIPRGAFSALATIESGGKIEGYLSHKLDKILAEQFTNYRYIVKEINDTLSITTKDPREKYEGNIDAIIEQTKADLESFKQTVDEVKEKLEQRVEIEKISQQGQDRAKQLLSDYAQVYVELLKELELKKRGLKLHGDSEVSGRDVVTSGDMVKANVQLEIKPLPGGGMVMMRGYNHDEDWQENFGDNRKQDFGLNDIYYSDIRYIAIEGSPIKPFGMSIGLRWKDNKYKKYDELMRQLVKAGFSGEFLELDGRYLVENSLDRKDLTKNEAEILFNYLKKINPKQAESINSWQQYRELFHHQRTQGKLEGFVYTGPSLIKNMQKEGSVIIKDGTLSSNNPTLNEDLTYSSSLTGFELGQLAFSDALSVIKIFLINKAMLDGNLEQGLLVDFQGAAHLHYKSLFFDNPQYAMEVVLTNVHEILPSLPGIESTEDVLKKLQNMDEKTWMQIFEFIGKIPLTKVEESTDERDSTEVGEKQREMSKPRYYSVIENLGKEDQKKLNDVIKELVLVT